MFWFSLSLDYIISSVLHKGVACHRCFVTSFFTIQFYVLCKPFFFFKSLCNARSEKKKTIAECTDGSCLNE